jgi:hypothetical protein
VLSKHTHRPLARHNKAAGLSIDQAAERAYDDVTSELERDHGGRPNAATRLPEADAVSRAETQAAAAYYRGL